MKNRARIPSERYVDTKCVYSSNRFHICNEYCSGGGNVTTRRQSTSSDSDDSLSRALAGLLVNPEPRMQRASTGSGGGGGVRSPRGAPSRFAKARSDLSRSAAKEEESKQGDDQKSVVDRHGIDMYGVVTRKLTQREESEETDAVKHRSPPPPVSVVEVNKQRSTTTTRKNKSVIEEPPASPHKYDIQSAPATPMGRPRLDRTMSGIVIRPSTPSRLDLESYLETKKTEETDTMKYQSPPPVSVIKTDKRSATTEKQIIYVMEEPPASPRKYDIQSAPATPMGRPRPEKTMSSIVMRRSPLGRSESHLDRKKTELSKGGKEEGSSIDQDSDTTEPNEKLVVPIPSRLPPLKATRLGVDDPPISAAKQRAAWSTTKACMSEIRDYLNKDPIDHVAIQVLLTSMENSEKDTGYSFEKWRISVANFAEEAKRFEIQNAIRLTEVAIIQREKALAEAKASLHEERVKLRGAEKASKNLAEAKEEIASDIKAIQIECEEVRKELVLKRRELEVRKKESLRNKKEHAYLQLSLEYIMEVVAKKEKIVGNAEAGVGMAEEDARAEQDRLSAILKQFISQLQGFEISHQRSASGASGAENEYI